MGWQGPAREMSRRFELRVARGSPSGVSAPDDPYDRGPPRRQEATDGGLLRRRIPPNSEVFTVRGFHTERQPSWTFVPGMAPRENIPHLLRSERTGGAAVGARRMHDQTCWVLP